MRRRKTYLVLALVGLAVVMATLLWPARSPEPIYNGQPLSCKPPPGGPHPWFFREAAASALGRIGPKAQPAVPELKRMLDDPGPHARRTAGLALWQIEHDTNLVGWAINELDARQGVHEYKALLRILEHIGPAAKPAVPAILQSMTNWGTDMSRVVRPALLRIDPSAAAQLAR